MRMTLRVLGVVGKIVNAVLPIPNVPVWDWLIWGAV